MFGVKVLLMFAIFFGIFGVLFGIRSVQTFAEYRNAKVIGDISELSYLDASGAQRYKVDDALVHGDLRRLESISSKDAKVYLSANGDKSFGVISRIRALALGSLVSILFSVLMITKRIRSSVKREPGNERKASEY